MASQRMQRVQDPIIPHIASLIRENPGTISLGQGVVHYPPPAAAASHSAKIWEDPGNHLYAPVAGIQPLLTALKAKLNADNAVNLTSDQCLVVTAGGNMAFLNALFAITEPGDEVILFAPCYFNHEMAITMLGCKAVLVEVDENYQPDIAQLQAAITPKTRAIVTNSPNNPTGAVYAEPTLRHINGLCQKQGIYHINDEAYEYFIYGETPHFSPAAIAGAAAHTISIFSMSKSFGFAGWRIGYMVAPNALRTAIEKAQDTNLINATVASQFAALGALEEGASYPRSFLSGLAKVRQRVVGQLATLADKCTVPQTEGAFYLFLKINTDMHALTLAEQLIKQHKVAVIPGTAFGMEKACYLRIAYGALEKAKVEEGVRRLVAGIDKLT
ncbi:MAG: pyridoxal phosphate-dependent aminotransferase [Bacteroidota bacterium]